VTSGAAVAPVTIRRGTIDDAAAAADVYLTSRRGAGALIPRATHTEDDVRTWFARIVLVEHEVWLAELEGRAVGVMVLRGDFMDQLYVRPEVQRRGVGGRLVAQAKRGRARLRLSTFQSNAPARDFYEKHGFKAIAFGDGTANEESAPDVLYEWRGILR
jgi:ribosomal protein S18 acetylase RimI-like enzyme